jgi:uncharacterized tellurite resistance protein B-like protein
MKELTYNERIAVMRILKDIILADNRIDDREQLLFTEIAKTLDLDESARHDVEKLNSLLALTVIHDFKQEQKEEFAKMMGQMIVVDKDINYNEVRIYNVVNEFCNIRVEFEMDKYPEYTRS